MVYVGYYLFSSYEIPNSVGEVLWSLGQYEMLSRHFTLGFEDVSEWVPESSSTPVLECTYVMNVS